MKLEHRVEDYCDMWNRQFLEALYEELRNPTAKIDVKHLSNFPELFIYAFKTREGISWDELFEMIDSKKATYEDLMKTASKRDYSELTAEFRKKMDKLMDKATMLKNGTKVAFLYPGKQFVGKYKVIENPRSALLKKVRSINLTSNPAEEDELQFYDISEERFVTQTSPAYAFFKKSTKEVFLLEGMLEFVARTAYHAAKSNPELKELVARYDSPEELTHYLRLNGLLHELGEYGLERSHFYGDRIDDTLLDFGDGIPQDVLDKAKKGTSSELIASALQFREADKDDKLRTAYQVWFKVKYDPSKLNKQAKKRYNAFLDALSRKGQVYKNAKRNFKNLVF